MATISSERVLAVRHWTDSQFTFTTTRDPGFRFANGQFVMLGLNLNDRPMLRAYSIASANHEDHLEFLSIKVPNGPLTSRLQHLREGDQILISRKPTGTLLLDDLRPGRRLYLLSTGTGAAPVAVVRGRYHDRPQRLQTGLPPTNPRPGGHAERFAGVA